MSALDNYYGDDELDLMEDDELDNDYAVRSDFLRDSAAIPTPLEIYAIWVELYERQGGTVNSSKVNFTKTMHVDERGNTYYVDGEENTAITHENTGWSHWTPTQNGGQIPALYGALSLTLLVIPEVTNQNLNPAKDDWRGGWEWGHSAILTIVRDNTSPFGFRAETNQREARSYADVDKLRREVGLEKMLANQKMHKTKAVSKSSAKEVEGVTVEKAGLMASFKKALGFN
jgi:hypothetical protein